MKSKSKFIHTVGKAFDRKGMGMELALLVLLVVFGCSTLLVSSAMMGKSSLQNDERQLLEQLTLDQLAEIILATDDVDLESIKTEAKFSDYAVFKADGDAWTNVLDRDGVETPIAASETIVLIITDLFGEPRLTVAMDADKKITDWSYD